MHLDIKCPSGLQLGCAMKNALEVFKNCTSWRLEGPAKYLGPLLLHFPVRIEPFSTLFKLCFSHLQEHELSFTKSRSLGMLLLGERYLK